MCGIVGEINFDPEARVDPGQIRRMADSLGHRGPDDDGVWVSNNAGLGHRRLAIIDLSPLGRNPMCNENGTVWIVFNGEIYNFKDLRPQLESHGHHFRSNTDTEVILHLYEEHGPKCVQFLRGMFAFAIWDMRTKALLLARDRLGVKPLYYTLNDSHLIFGSEIKAILRRDYARYSPDMAALHQFLLWQCIPAPRTAFAGVKKLPPASTLTWRQGGQVEIKQYWHLEARPKVVKSIPTLASEIRDIVQEATQLRLVSDVPLGVFLSGGVDSACVLAAAYKETSERLNTFSVVFGHEQFDESMYARQLAQQFNTKHHEFHVTPKIMDLLPKMAALFDEPFADPAAIPTYYLAQLTREHVTVALSGDGGDEAFGGYQRYLALKFLSGLKRIPGARRFAALHKLIPYQTRERGRLRYLREVLGLAELSSYEQYRALMLGMIDEEAWHSFYTDSFRQLAEDEENHFLAGWAMTKPVSPLSAAMLSDTLGYIPDCLNVKVDICSMAFGLEVRSPFLDHKLVEACAQIPETLKIHGMTQKYILKQAFMREVPSNILHRKKAGFSLPLADWFRSDLREITNDLLLSSQSRIRALFDVKKIQSMIHEHLTRRRNWHIQLWRLLVLENWLQSVSSVPASQDEDMFSVTQNSICSHASQLPA